MRNVMLKAAFYKAWIGEDGPAFNEDRSRWEVWDDNVHLMTISVEEIKRSNPITNYKLIATKEFGEALLERVKKNKAFI
jgi:hypothetical protein